MAACATGPYALVLVPALMYASYKASDYVEEKQNQLESWINSFCDTDGAINTGSENVKINGKPAARAPSPFPLLPHLEQYLKSHRGNPHGVILPLTCLNRQRKKAVSQQAMVASQMKRAANDKAIAQMLASKKVWPPRRQAGR